MDSFTDFLDLFGRKKTTYFLIIFFSVLIIYSIIVGKINGWIVNLFYVKHSIMGPRFELHLKPISLFSYSLLGLAISILLLFRTSFAQISNNSKLTIALLALIPEFIWGYEFIWHFFYWAEYHMADTIYWIISTKMNLMLVFISIALQITLLFASTSEGTNTQDE